MVGRTLLAALLVLVGGALGGWIGAIVALVLVATHTAAFAVGVLGASHAIELERAEAAEHMAEPAQVEQAPGEPVLVDVSRPNGSGGGRE